MVVFVCVSYDSFYNAKEDGISLLHSADRGLLFSSLNQSTIARNYSTDIILCTSVGVYKKLVSATLASSR